MLVRKTELPEACEVNPSLLNAPIYVLNDASARKLDCIEVKWQKNNVNCIFRFIRAATDPLPTPTHAKYLDILLAMFADNWDGSGKLYFRYCDVLRIAGKAHDSRSNKAVQQTIQRYSRHITEWVNSWKVGASYTFTIIRGSSILDEQGNLLTSTGRNPGKTIPLWHWVQFDPKVVKALKDEKRRFFLTKLYKYLSRGAFCVYRYYYGYPDSYVDSNGQKRPNHIWRSIDQLREIFKWTGQKNRFLPWLETQLGELLKLKVINPPVWNDNKTAVCVHCKNLEEIRNNTDCTTTENVNQSILEEYYNKKSKNLIPEQLMSTIDFLLNSNLTEAALQVIREKVLIVR